MPVVDGAQEGAGLALVAKRRPFMSNGQSGGESKGLKVETLVERVTHSPEETVIFGREVAAYFQPPCLVLLEGDLGAGKTTLAKGIVAGLGAAREEEVTSPTFTLVHEYGAGGTVFHVDLYRIEGARDLATLGLDDLSSQPATVLVEWGEKLGDNVPQPCFKVRMEHQESDNRRIVIERLGA